ncbi:MAG: YHS domain-containing protein [Candidatus Thorarchaeota archaeon]
MGDRKMAKCPVCKRIVDEETAERTSEYRGKRYCFRTDLCKKRFDVNPTVFTMRRLDAVPRRGCCG